MKRAHPSSALPKKLLGQPADAPKHRQLYQGLRDAIVGGRLASGCALPSSRTISKSLRVSRNTVVTAFEQLIAEGYVQARVGAGTFVATSLHSPVRRVAPRAGRPTLDKRSLSKRGELLASQRIRAFSSAQVRPFRSGTPALDEFPFGLWTRLTAHCIRHAPRALLSYSDPAGYRPLREAIAAYLATSRAVRCSADQVIVVSGSQEALDLTARLALDAGDAVWMEDPGYRGARAAFAGNGARIVGVPLDRSGLDVESGIRHEPRPRLIYVTPSCQFPTTVTMSLERRLSLLAFARRAGAWIVEDDYDSEFRYTGRPQATLQGLDDGARVIYLGTFSKVLFPGLRLGYVVAPPDLVDAFTAARAVVDRNSPGIEQAVVAHFLSEGHFARHVRRMRERYAERQATLVDAANRSLSGILEVEPSDVGMHLVGRFMRGRDDAAAARVAFQHGVDVVPLSVYYLNRTEARGLILCYTAVPPPAIRDGVRKHRDALR